MKKILTGFVFCLSITSCSLDTIPTSQYVEDNFWKTPEQIEAGLVACLVRCIMYICTEVI